MPDYLWHEFVNALLHWFDDMEGTTYLYDKDMRKCFIKELPKEIQSTAELILAKYHDEERVETKRNPGD